MNATTVRVDPDCWSSLFRPASASNGDLRDRREDVRFRSGALLDPVAMVDSTFRRLEIHVQCTCIPYLFIMLSITGEVRGPGTNGSNSVDAVSGLYGPMRAYLDLYSSTVI
ncbi:hypothetical protein PPL_11054 [Heterostelium album PN500]|uniref:Uncharacterized protein n=1 Tax=Heterostelium pallidum (strain ATCC 26659 / Pp 5 / PN500) TaxID=670386 RepID=D3BST4_HETP5|nr:hypothetical protein PPL_11054 [Heterostelium album PN500]EFA75549.1 hypothetical protein PPL_11054 [Heterostelium album PN500]|eukprot:XP_020427683.1 hypothetical protein PPL_11054 [Heterostelium album PN500]